MPKILKEGNETIFPTPFTKIPSSELPSLLFPIQLPKVLTSHQHLLSHS